MKNRRMIRSSVVFLDRDGTINRNFEDGPVYDAKKFELLPRAAEAIRLLNELGVRVVVVTNQGGITHPNRAFGWEKYFHIERLLHEGLARDAGAHVDAVLVCPHADYAQCGCRKPETGLFKRAAITMPFDPSSSYMVGDSEVDIIAGQTVGLNTVLVESGWKRDVRETLAEKGIVADMVVTDLLAAAKYIYHQLT